MSIIEETGEGWGCGLEWIYELYIFAQLFYKSKTVLKNSINYLKLKAKGPKERTF